MKSVILSLILLLSINYVVSAKTGQQTSQRKNVLQAGKTIVYFNQECAEDDPKYSYYYRVYLGKTAQGYQIQDFYTQNKKKYTDPVTVKSQSEIKNCSPKIIGEYKIWYSSGKLKGHRYDKGVGKNKEAWWTGYYENGQKAAEGRQDKNDDLDGFWVYWYENGNKSEEGRYLMSGREGLWKSWHENSQLKCQGQYENRQLEGSWTCWHENGQKSEEGGYHKSRKTGHWNFWDKNGTPLKSKVY